MMNWQNRRLHGANIDYYLTYKNVKIAAIQVIFVLQRFISTNFVE